MIIGDCLIGDAPGAAGALHCTIDLIAANEIYIEPTCRDQLRFWKIYIILVLLNIVSESSYKNKMLREKKTTFSEIGPRFTFGYDTFPNRVKRKAIL